jgi:hypothetical protein
MNSRAETKSALFQPRFACASSFTRSAERQRFQMEWRAHLGGARSHPRPVRVIDGYGLRNRRGERTREKEATENT